MMVISLTASRQKYVRDNSNLLIVEVKHQPICFSCDKKYHGCTIFLQEQLFKNIESGISPKIRALQEKIQAEIMP